MLMAENTDPMAAYPIPACWDKKTGRRVSFAVPMMRRLAALTAMAACISGCLRSGGQGDGQRTSQASRRERGGRGREAQEGRRTT